MEQYIFDTSGQKVFNQRQMLQKYWTNASACCLVYDVSNRDSFLALGQWLNEIKATRRGSSLPGVLVANKCDLRSSGRQVVGSDEVVGSLRKIMGCNSSKRLPFEELM